MLPNEEIFLAAAALPAGERRAFLEVVCAGDMERLARVEQLLLSHDAVGFMAIPPTVLTPAGIPGTLKTKARGEQVGAYRLLERIGEGGFGTVWVAEQERPIRRRVALKIIKPGMDTREVIARFEQERQALALMEHPNIAKVLDAGATPTGRPYFVMELVRGIRITDYCDQAKLPVAQRLELFIAVCQAVQHAHQKGVIHRDIKPSNILVTLHDGIPVPKVIDFGIAKATQARLTEDTIYTQFEQMIGTPLYMSPEQAEMSGLDIDTRSDIYSLGVLLYELLTGRTPFDPAVLMKAGLDEMRRMIREQTPAKPSTALLTMASETRTKVAQSRQADPAKIVGRQRGDLDWIVMKALEKDRTRRYETANGLAQDIRRHLGGESVLAVAPTALYRFGKFARRNRAVIAVVTLLSTVLAIATGVSLRQAAEERAAREESEVIVRFLAEVFQSPSPSRDGRTITVAETLDKAARKLNADLAEQPARRASLQRTLGETYYALGLHMEAAALQEKALDYYLAALGPGHPATIRTMLAFASSSHDAGFTEKALKLREETLTLCRSVFGPAHPDTIKAMIGLGNSYRYADRLEEALNLREEALTLSREINGATHPDTLQAMMDVGSSYRYAGRREEALKLNEETLTLRVKVSGPEHPDTLRAMHNVAASYHDAGRMAEALRVRETELALNIKVNGPDHPRTLIAMNGLAGSYHDAGRMAEALKLREEDLALNLKMNKPDHPDTLTSMIYLADACLDAGFAERAFNLREEALALSLKLKGPQHPDTLLAMQNLADSLMAAGNRERAMELLAEASALASAHDSLLTLKITVLQAWFGRVAEYETACRRLLSLAAGTDDPVIADRAAKVCCFRPGMSPQLLDTALGLAKKAVSNGSRNSYLPWFNLTLGMAHYRCGNFKAADESLTAAEQGAGKLPEDHAAIVGTARFFHSMSYFRQGNENEAATLFHQASTEMKPDPFDNEHHLINKANHNDLILWLASREVGSMLHHGTPP